MEALLDQINHEVILTGGSLAKKECTKWRRKYRLLLNSADIDVPRREKTLRKLKSEVAWPGANPNLLERLRD
jgi:hypothetical protein